MRITSLKYGSPYSCYINLTERCNLRCKHCFGNYGLNRIKELTFEEWKKAINDLIVSHVFYANISGGEPTQSPYFKDFIKYLSKKGMHFILTTNGVLSEDIRKFIVLNKNYLIGVKISLDGPDKESHGFIRLDSQGKYNPYIFKITMKNILYFKEKNIPLTIATTLHIKNIKKINQMIKLIKKINPVSWFVSPIIPLGRGDENSSITEYYEFYDISFWQNLQKTAKESGINLRLIDLPVNMGEKGLSAYECSGALNFCEIHSDGVVSPCSLSRVSIPKSQIKFENIKDKTLQEIWAGNAFEKFRSFMNKGCDGCRMIGKCNKCIAQSFKYFDNGYSPTPFCVKNGIILGLKHQNNYKSVLKNKFNLDI